jgi:mannose-6-phosphate isomerase-like protein (cupin superfamily)
MQIQRFDKSSASPAHSDTILASDFLPAHMRAPFEAAWGYLETGGTMEAHKHPTEEIYVVIEGQGLCTVGEETRPVSPGDVIEIPPEAMHTMACPESGHLLWAAIWWPVA